MRCTACKSRNVSVTTRGRVEIVYCLDCLSTDWLIETGVWEVAGLELQVGDCVAQRASGEVLSFGEEVVELPGWAVFLVTEEGLVGEAGNASGEAALEEWGDVFDREPGVGSMVLLPRNSTTSHSPCKASATAR